MTRWTAGFMGLVMVAMTGCAVTFAKRSPWDIQQLTQLSDELEQFKTLARLKSEEADELRRTKAALDSRLTSSEASVGYDERGLVTRFGDRVLFDSGKATLRRSANPVLDKVASVLQEFPNQPLGVEGHTDNEPIKRSGWDSNKALSVARARAVVDYLVEQHQIDPARFTVIGYGETQPIADNETPEGRQQNRRVELVVLPQASEDPYRGQAQRINVK